MKQKAPLEEEVESPKPNENIPVKPRARQSNSSSPTTGSPTSDREANDFTKGDSSYQTQTKASICPVAPDGYYGWVIVASSFMTNMICDGLAFSFGILFPEIQRRYGTGKGISATVGGLFMAMPLLAGPVASSLIERRDFRNVTIIGSVISFFGILLSAFAPNVAVLCLTFGFICGAGLSVCYTTAVVAVTHYFEARRGLATSIAISGGGVGSIAFPPFVGMLLEWYGWQGTWMILSGIALHLCLCAALFRDLRFSPRKLANAAFPRGDFVSNAHEANFSVAIRLAEIKLRLEQNFKRNKKAAAKLRRKLSMQRKTALSKTKQKTRKSTKGKGMPLPNETGANMKKQKRAKQKERSPNKEKRQTDHREESDVDIIPVMYDAVKDESLKSGPTDSSGSKVLTLRTCHEKVPEVPQFCGRHYAAQKLLLNPPKWYYRRKKKGVQTRSPNVAIQLWNFIKQLASFIKTRVSMFQSLKFTEFMISNFLLFAFNDIFYVNLPEYVTMALNVSEQQASWLVPITGVANTLSIPLFGALADSQKVNNCACYGVCTIISGICILALPFVNSYSGICGLCAVFGLFVSASASLTAVIVVELLSFEQFVGAFGTLHLVQGIGNLAGTPFAGALYDWTGSYRTTFFTGGSGLILSGILAAASEVTPKRITPAADANKGNQKEDMTTPKRKPERIESAKPKKELALQDAISFDEKNEKVKGNALAAPKKPPPNRTDLQNQGKTAQANVRIERNEGARAGMREVSPGNKREDMREVEAWLTINDEQEREGFSESESFSVLKRKRNQLHTQCESPQGKRRYRAFMSE